MNTKSAIRKNGLNFLLIGLLLLLLFNHNAKGWVLNKFLHTGFFNVNTTKSETQKIKTPDLIFTGLPGTKLSTKQLKGKTIFMNFWAAWCPPCIAEMPTINELHKKLKADTNIVFIMVDADNNLSKSSAFMKSNHYDLPVFIADENIPEDMMSGTLPTTVIIHASGDVVKKIEGMSNYNTDNMEAYLKSLHQ